MSTPIAIIGAGGAGCCVALELASRGRTVELFERHPEAVSEATFVNEGKVHLGLIYARDASLRTASQMIDGALEFEANLKRWVSFTAADYICTPFYYCVHRGTLTSPAELQVHYDRCARLYDERARATGLDYLGMGVGSTARRLAPSEYPTQLDPAYFDGIFETSELGVDPRGLAELLRDAVAHEPRITLRTEHCVLGIQQARNGDFDIRFEHDERVSEERFSHVANTSWYRRLALDRPLGITPPGPWSHRYKFGHRVRIPVAPMRLPSITCVQGPFGDIVNYRARGVFLSWYPEGRTAMSTAASPPDWDAEYTTDFRRTIFDRSLIELMKRCPTLDELPIDHSNTDPSGGVIYALGTTDVDDPASRLHDRHEVGIQSRGRYHSLDTGKFTLIPYWAPRLADAIEGKLR